MELLVVTESRVGRVREPELMARFPDRTSLMEGRSWAFATAMARAFELREQPWTHYLLLGRRVGAAFGIREDAKTLHWYECDGVAYAVVPLSAAGGADGRAVRAFLRTTLSEIRQAVPA